MSRKKPRSPTKAFFRKQSARFSRSPSSPSAIKVKGYDDLMTYLAKCCNPLPGERIVGYITRGKGVAVHSANCPNVKNLMFNPDREIAVEWADQRQAQFQVELEILMEDRQGILARVVSTIANLKTNIRQMETRTVDGQRDDRAGARDRRPQAPREGDALDRRTRRRDAGGAEVQRAARHGVGTGPGSAPAGVLVLRRTQGRLAADQQDSSSVQPS